MKLEGNDLIKKVAKNSGVVLAGTSMGSVLNLVSFVVMANQLGPELLAFLVLAQVYAGIVNDIFNVQTWESMIKFGSYDSKDGGLASVVKANLVLDVCSAVVAFLFAIFLASFVVRILSWDEALVSIISLYSLSILSNITSLTIGIPRLFDRFSVIARIQVATAFLKLISVLCAAYFGKSLMYYIGIYLVVGILANVLLIVFSLILLRSRIGKDWYKNKLKLDKHQIKFIWWTNLRATAGIPVKYFDMIVINSVISLEMVGVYKVYKEIASVIKRIEYPVNRSIYPEFTKLLARKYTAEAAHLAKKAILILCVLGVPITLIMLAVSELVIGKFFGSEYLPDINALFLMLIFYLFSFITAPINALFVAAGFAKSGFMIVLFTNTVYLIVAFGGGMIFGVYGVIIAYAVQLFVTIGLKILLLKKYSYDWGSTIR